MWFSLAAHPSLDTHPWPGPTASDSDPSLCILWMGKLRQSEVVVCPRSLKAIAQHLLQDLGSLALAGDFWDISPPAQPGPALSPGVAPQLPCPMAGDWTRLMSSPQLPESLRRRKLQKTRLLVGWARLLRRRPPGGSLGSVTAARPGAVGARGKLHTTEVTPSPPPWHPCIGLGGLSAAWDSMAEVGPRPRPLQPSCRQS